MTMHNKFHLHQPRWLGGIIAPIITNRWLLAASTLYALMFVLGSIRALERSLIWTFNDKLLHFGAYFVLTALIYLGLRLRPVGEFFLPRALTCLATVFCLGALDEIAQYFVGRDPSFDDWLADAAAAVILLLIVGVGHAIARAWSQYNNPAQDEV